MTKAKSENNLSSEPIQSIQKQSLDKLGEHMQLEEEKRPFREFGLNMVLERLLLTVNRLMNIF